MLFNFDNVIIATIIMAKSKNIMKYRAILVDKLCFDLYIKNVHDIDKIYMFMLGSLADTPNIRVAIIRQKNL